MGTKIKAKYDGQCKICGEEWTVGDDIYYQKTPKAICGELECFNIQGGNLTSKSFQKNFTGGNVIITRVPEIQLNEDTELLGTLWKQYFVKAHQLTKETYPEEDVNSDRFGMIRQTVLNQLVSMAGVVVAKNNGRDG